MAQYKLDEEQARRILDLVFRVNEDASNSKVIPHVFSDFRETPCAMRGEWKLCEKLSDTKLIPPFRI